MSEATVKLGLMPPLTGLVSIYGTEISRAAQIACQEVNENGGVLGRPLQLIIEDDGSLPESAVAAAEKLVDQHRCIAIIGNLLSNSRIAVAYRVAEPRKIPLINFSFYEGSILSRYFFHFAGLPNQQIDHMIPYMQEKFGPRMFFAGNNYEWPRGSIHAAKLALARTGGKIAGEEYCPIGVDAASIERLLDHVDKAKPDVFVPYFAGVDQVNLLTRFTERGMKKHMAAVMGHYDEMMASILPAEVREGFYSSNTYFMSVDTAESRDYLARLSKLPGVNGIWPNGNGILTNFGEGTYVCVKAFAKAANLAGNLDTEALVEALSTISVVAPQGEVKMNPAHHHARINTYLTRCESDGAFTIIEKFGAIDPILPDRYKHQQITQHATLEDDIRLQSRILEQLSEAVLLISSQDSLVRYASEGAERMFGYGKGEMIGLPLTKLNDPSWGDPLQTAARIIDILNQSGEWQGETRNIRKDGSPIWCELKVSTFTHPVYGEVWLCVQRDITERKQAEVDLHIAAIAFESQQAMMITDAKEVILRVNRAFIESTGFTDVETVGQTPRLLKSGRHDADFYHEMWEAIHRNGTWQGEIWDRRKNGEVYPKWLTITAVKGSDGVVTHYVGVHDDITERKAAEKEIRTLAFYDPLTHLPNRRLFMDRLQQALPSSARLGRKGGLMLIDLDNFKILNDTLGHQIGDLLLQQVAQRLSSCLREDDSVARLGGDEFVVLLEGLSEHASEATAQTEAIGEKILASLKQPYHLDAHEFHCTSSIGATLINGTHQATDELLKQADIAMYQAKKAGRNTLRFFNLQMQLNITGRVSLESELHKALEKKQFRLYYQIQVDSTLRPLGAEALIRWLHPERGLAPPMQFIPLAEETGLILPIGQWVLDTACAQIKAWQNGPLTRDLVLAVNVSAKQFRQNNFVAQVKAALQRHAINPMLLKLELTEGMLLENIEDTIATMNELNGLGVQFSLDDFGTGYSSLQYLKQLPVDQLKIDKSFIQDIATNGSDIAIVRTIVAMARSLSMDVIAEGVETDEQQKLLLKNGCLNYQGYLFGRPVPIEQFDTSLSQK